MRIIVDRGKNCRWGARWHDEPERVFTSGSVLGAVAKLLIKSPNRHVAASDLVTDAMACEREHVELIVVSAS